MDQPLIAVTTSVAVGRGPERAMVNASYLTALGAAGGVPLLIPPQLSPGALEQLLEAVDGLLLTGGGDVSPALYGESPDPTLVGVSEARDAVEIACVRFAMDRDLPILALCRGMQVLNVALGGTLVQDIHSAMPDALAHAAGEARDEPVHAVHVDPASGLARLLGATDIDVNSRHHQAIGTPGEGLVVAGCAPDGVIEALEMPGRAAFLAAVEWHPEDMTPHADHARRLFSAFVAAARG